MRVLFVNRTVIRVGFLYSAKQVGSRVYAITLSPSYLPFNWRKVLKTRELIQYAFLLVCTHPVVLCVLVLKLNLHLNVYPINKTFNF